MISKSPILFTLGYAVSVSAQYDYPYYGNHHSIAGSVIAGIIVAIVCGLLLLSLVCMLGRRRRRRGQSMLPISGGFTRVTRTSVPNYPPQNTAGYGNNQFNQQGQNGWTNPNTGSYQQSVDAAPPPPYQPKEGSVQTNEDPIQNSSFVGGFAPPPGTPPAAHVNDQDRTGFRGSR